ncbi:lateral signaling target protein 2 homolog isoform X2 [Tigriopus californicus]|uniref:lateral signaling target protein 2 homolog isoform X2 n=1 Tax=Tigriopus californicus TaxID=6832 RepID=UPI0027DA4E72|nr:lateral signaling target protein 2 homolog isoform X2 [Tigriopus californicus]
MEKVGIFTSRIVREELIEEEHSIIRYHHHGHGNHHHHHHHHHHHPHHHHHHSDGIRKKKMAQNKELHRKAEKELKRMERTDQSSLFGSQAVFTFVHPTEKLKITYREQQSRLRLAVARHRDLQEGAVLDTLEKGVGYPVIHVNFHPKIKPPSDQPSMRDQGSGLIGHGTRQRAEPKTIPNNNNPNNSSSHSGIAPSPSVGSLLNQVPHPHSCWASSSSSSSQVQKSSSSSSVNNHYRSSFSTSTSSYSTSTSNAKRSSSTSHLTSGKSGTNSSIPKLLKENALGPAVHVQQGLYEEVKRIEPDFAFSPRDNIDTRAYIILGFKTLDTGFSSVLEQTWRDWTGARAIYLRLHNDFDLSKIVFYHRVHPKNDLDMFMYIVLVECWNVNAKNLIHILDFVQRMRVERLNGYISLYRDLGLEEEDSNYHSASQESLNNYAYGEDHHHDQSMRQSISPSAFSFATEVDEALDIIEEHHDLTNPITEPTKEETALEDTRHREVLVVETKENNTKKKKHHKHHKSKSHKNHSHHHHHHHQQHDHLHEPIHIETDNIGQITVESRQIP